VHDQHWMEKIAGGDHQAFRQLYEHYAPAIYRLCLRFLNNQSEAEDAVQDIFVKIHHSLADFKGRSKLATWIYRISVNHCLNLKRKRRLASFLNLEFLDAFHPAHADSAPDPQQALEQDESEKLLRQAIQKLPSRQRLALILSRYEGKSYQEIAEVMACSIPAVEACLHHAKKNLAAALKKYLEK